jgi:cell division protein ZapA (FtsZ GTPase activity inhibitor)
MLKSPRNHRIEIAGHALTVRSAADAEYVAQLAERLEARVRPALDQGAGVVNAVLLAALGLADELQRAQADLETLKGAVADRAAALRSAAS